MIYRESFRVSTPTDREIQVTRLFDAPHALVFDAFTKPELVRRWLLGPPGWTMPICEIDLKVGGEYRYIWSNEAKGNEMGMSGVFREIVSPKRIVATERFDESWYPGDALDTTVFVEEDGNTRMTITVLYDSMESRDTARRSGMERGMASSYDRPEELLSAMSESVI